MTSQWAEDLVQQRRAKEGKLRLQEEARIIDRKRIQDNAEGMYRNIVRFINAFASELNEAWGDHAVTVANLTANEIEVSSDAGKAKVKLVARDQMLSVSFYGGELRLAVNSSDKLTWQSSAESSKYWTDEEVAKLTVEYAWRPGNPPSR